MRTSSFLPWIAVVLVGCGVSDVDVGAQESFGTWGPTTSLPPCGTTPTTMARIPNLLSAPFFVDGSDVLVVARQTAGDSENETIWRVPKAGGSPVAVASSQSEIGGMTTGTSSGGDDLFLAWTTGSPGANGAVWKSTETGPLRLADGLPSPGPIVGFGDRLYWGEGDGVMWIPSEGGAVTILQQTPALQPPRGITIARSALTSADDLAWTTADRELTNATDAVVVATALPLALGASTTLAGPDAGLVGAVATLGGAGNGPGFEMPAILYSTAGGIMKVVRPGPPELFAALSGVVSQLVLDGTSVYFVDPATHALMAYPYASEAGAPRVVLPGMDPFTSFGVDEQCLWWVDPGTETVQAMALR